MAVFMEYTDVPDTKTVAEIQHLLARRGASSVLVEYENGHVSGVAFKLLVGDQEIPFRLPCRWQSVLKILKVEGKKLRRADTEEGRARRVAWRQILRWCEAQFALIATGMVKTDEVFMPYIITQTPEGEQSMYQLVAKSQYMLADKSKEG